MIPTMILVGAAIGLVTRRPWWLLPAGVFWDVLLITDDTSSYPPSVLLAGFLLGVINAAVGFAAARGPVAAVRAGWSRIHSTPVRHEDRSVGQP